MGFLNSVLQREHYSPLPSQAGRQKEEADGLQSPPQSAKQWTTHHLHLLLVCFLTACISIPIGIKLGSSHPHNLNEGLLAPAGTVKYPMHYNVTFSQAPSPETDAAWSSLFPKGVGFVRHPVISLKLSGIAVFHELHCLDMLRHTYYAALSGTLPELSSVEKTPDQNHRADPHHVQHCFDYLRQSLMCAADTNLEPVSVELGGVTGWGFERVCRDFGAVRDWAGRWGSSGS